MRYKQEYRYIDVEESQWVRGGMYRVTTVRKQIKVCVLTADAKDADDLRALAILSDRLSVPIVWNTDTTPQTFSLTIQAGP